MTFVTFLIGFFQKLSSRFLRLVAQNPWPNVIQTRINSYFCQWYNLDLSEAVQKDPTLYPTLDALFVRELELEIYRPMGSSEYIHPCDSTLVAFGKIEPNLYLQVKKKPYKIHDLITVTNPNEYFDGSFFVYYLCPRDYHRVHAPMTGKITKIVRAGSMLWPVNSWSSRNVTQVFAQNERVALEIVTPLGKYWLILVAALNVGDIEIFQDTELRHIKSSGWLERIYQSPITINKGEAIGAFHLGSTVIVLVSQSIQKHLQFESPPLPLSVKVRSSFH